MRLRPIGAAAVSVALCLGLAGCGEDSPKPGPVAESSTSSAPSAQEFTRTFIKTLNAASTSLDTSQWRSMFSSKCAYCERIADQLDSIKSNGGSFDAEPWTITSIKTVPATDGPELVQLTARIPGQRVRYKSGGKIERFNGEMSAKRELKLSRNGNGWLATDFGEGAR